MGGCSYDRDVYSSGDSYSSSGFHSSPLADATFTKASVREVDPALSPLNRTLECSTKTGIVIALDVTGSMGDSAKLLYDKLPMLWGQLEQQGYLKDFSISFAAVGDCRHDGAPFQICDFAEGKKIDGWVEKLFLEGGGGGGGSESYEMLAYFYAHKVRFTHPKAGVEKPFLFIIGDEAPYAELPAEDIKQQFGEKVQGDVSTKAVFDQVRKKYNFKQIHVPYSAGKDPDTDKMVEREWKKAVGEDFLKVSEPKAVVDVLLGTVAILTGKRTLEEYQQDMRDRNQTEERIANVTKALSGLDPLEKSDKAAAKTTKPGHGKSIRL